MRIVIAVLLGVVALGAAGFWLLAEYGGAGEPVLEARAPIVREPEVLPPLTADNDGPQALESAPAPMSAPEPLPELAAEPEGDAAKPDASAERALRESLQIAPGDGARARQLPAEPPAEPRIATAQAPAASPAAEPTVSVAQNFKSRRVTYNRPPERLILDRAIDVSLVVNATDNEDAGAEALQGFPGTVVDRDVDLSDIVSAQLTGVGFDITSQTVERQKLSGKTLNRWQWRVTPTETGTRTLILEIFGYESGSLDAEPLDAYRDDIVVEVEQIDQLLGLARRLQPAFALLAALAGIGSAVFAFLRFREEKKRNTPPPAA